MLWIKSRDAAFMQTCGEIMTRTTAHTLKLPKFSTPLGLYRKIKLLCKTQCRVVKFPIVTRNKFVQSNLGRRPPRSIVARVRRKVPIGYNGAPQIRPQKYPFPWTDPRSALPASSLDPSDLWCQTASWSDSPLFPQCTGQTDARTDRQIVHGKVWRL